MKLPSWLPRLNRKQKVVRNLLTVALLLFLAWAARDFHAFTPDQALRWKAEGYGLSQPEVLCRTEWRERDRRDVVLRAGDVFATAMEYRFGWMYYTVSDFQFAEPEGGPVVFLQEYGAGEPKAVYVYADLPEAARAVCDLRLQGIANGVVFDETYTMEAEPNEQGIYRFLLERKYPNGNTKTAEELILWVFQSAADGAGDPDFSYDMTVTFYDTVGNEVYAYEKAYE